MLIWKNGQKIRGTPQEYIEQLRQVADRADARFLIYSDETGLLGDFIRCAAENIERLCAAIQDIAEMQDDEWNEVKYHAMRSWAKRTLNDDHKM